MRAGPSHGNGRRSPARCGALDAAGRDGPHGAHDVVDSLHGFLPPMRRLPRHDGPPFEKSRRTASIAWRRRAAASSPTSSARLDGLEQIGVNGVQPPEHRVQNGHDLVNGNVIQAPLADGEQDGGLVPGAERAQPRLFERLAEATAALIAPAGLGLQLGPEAGEGLELVQLGVQEP